MKLTKLEHACVVLEDQTAQLVIDPGGLSRNLPELQRVAAVVITHAHYDHLNAEHVAQLAANNPGAQFFGTSEVAAALPDVAVTIVHAGSEAQAGPFGLRFYGGQHALVRGKTAGQNVGVMVNGALYFPGDSYDAPDDGTQPETLLLPVSGPWFAADEMTNFIERVQPKVRCIPTHDGLLSEPGTPPIDSWLPEVCSRLHVQLVSLAPGESIDI